MSSEAPIEAPAAALPRPLFSALNRGVAVASIYAALLVLAFEALMACTTGDLDRYVFGAIGFVAGSIGGFSNTSDRDRAGPDLVQRNLLDALMIALWASVLLLGASLVAAFAEPEALYARLGFLAAGALIGGVLGEPVLAFLAHTRVIGRRPFLLVNRVTKDIESADVRFVVRVVLETLVFAALAALAVVAVVLVIALIALWLTLVLAGHVLSDGDSRGSVTIVRRRRVPEGRVVLPAALGDAPTGLRIDRDARLVEDNLAQVKTPFRVDEDGQIVRGGIIGDQRTGLKVEEDGRITRDGPLGIRVESDGRALDPNSGPPVGPDTGLRLKKK